MAGADSELKLPGKFEPGKKYVLMGETLIAWRKALLADRVLPGAGLIEQATPNGGRMFIALAQPGVAGEGGAFYTLVERDGHTYLQGGSITGGNGGSETIVDYKVIDGSTGPTGTDGQILYLKVTCTATVADGVMLPGCEVTAATTGKASSLPANHAFTVTSLSGDLHLELGRWTADTFFPAAPGNVHASGCIGNFELGR